MTVSPRDADVIRQALADKFGTVDRGYYVSHTELCEEAAAALDRLVARVHALERALGEIAAEVHYWRHGARSLGEVPPMPDRTLILRIEDIIAPRAVVLEGAARQEQDLGGNVNVARGGDES